MVDNNKENGQEEEEEAPTWGDKECSIVGRGIGYISWGFRIAIHKTPSVFKREKEWVLDIRWLQILLRCRKSQR